MVRNQSRKSKRDRPLQQISLVPWKELAAGSPTSKRSTAKDSKVFDFLEDEANGTNILGSKEAEDADLGEGIKIPGEISSVSFTPSEKPEEIRKSSREVSPMQEELLLEQKWQNELVKMDELLSDVSAPHKGEFSERLFVDVTRSKEFLSLFFDLFDWKDNNSVPQEKIINSARQTLQGHGSREWVELLEVIAYVICEDREVTRPCFWKIFRSKSLLEKLFKVMEKDGELKTISRHQLMDFIANLTYGRPRKGVGVEHLERLENMFREALGTKQELSFDDFKKIVHSRNSFFAERVFQIFDRDRSGSVSLSEFLDAMHQFAGKSPKDKIKFLFRVYDLDGDGLIQMEELERVMTACLEENGMSFSPEQIEELTQALFEDADVEGRGEITYEALKAQLEKQPGLLENLSISIDRWLVPMQPSESQREKNLLDKVKKLWPYQLTLPYLKNNYVYILFLLLFVGVNIGLFVDRALTIYNQGHNTFYILARASGQCLNFNCSFVLIMVLRQLITFLRSHGASSYLPLDQHLYFHKICGWFILFHSLLHTVMHLINFPTVIVYSPELNPNGYSAVQWLFTSLPGAFGLVPGWANPTGIILIVVLLIMVVCSQPFVRKSGYFEVFYWTHVLYVVFWVLTILHGPNFWKWFVGPAVLFAIQKIHGWYQMRTGQGKTYISSGILLPSKVTHLVIQKPTGFNFSPGDYVFVNIPSIAKYEWHPITISSAPEQEGALWLHIRAVGEWTTRLYNYFEKQQDKCDKKKLHQKLSVKITSDKDVLVDIENTSDLFEKENGNSRLELIENSNRADVNTNGRKNGIANVGYESETVIERNESKVPSESISPEPDPLVQQGFLNKSRLVKTKSVPDLEDRMKNRERKFRHRENWRNNSMRYTKCTGDMDDDSDVAVNRRIQQIQFPTNRSVAMSVRYMRRKPKVVTLDLPVRLDDGDQSCTDEESWDEKEIDSNKSLNDIEAQESTSVRRANGSFFDRRRVSRKSRQEISKSQRRDRLKEAEVFGQCTVGKPLVVYIDGPYGAPSSHIFRAQHAVLIGTGIGVTPFASILQSIMYRYHKALQVCPRCDHSWASEIPESVMYLRKVDFFWINRDQRSFEWFVNLLSQLEIEQAEQGGALERFLDMHMYITSALQKTDMKAVGLQLALDLLHEKEKRDLITGLKTRTNAGRPNWDKVFKQLSNQHKGKITVFYCGPPELGRILRKKCDEFGFHFRKEVF